MCASQWVLIMPKGAMKVKTGSSGRSCWDSPVPKRGKHQRPVPSGLRWGGVGAYTLGPERW